MKITAKHPVRKAVTTLPTYHNTKGSMASMIANTLENYDLEITFPEFDGPSGTDMCTIRPSHNANVLCDCCERKLAEKEYDNCVVISWYVLASGRVELTVYIS